jgi:hypothetical protein
MEGLPRGDGLIGPEDGGCCDITIHRETGSVESLGSAGHCGLQRKSVRV